MTRSLVLIPILLAGCSVGEYGESSTPTDSMGGGNDRNLCANKAATPAAPYMHTTMPTGPRAGMGCIAAGCHDGSGVGAGASKFEFAGTVFKEPAGTTPQPGVVVRIFPGTMPMKSIATATTDTAGNFYIKGGPYMTFPYQTDVTACGSDAQAMGIRTMVGAIGRGDQNCNAGNTCHQAMPNSATPIYLRD